MLGPADASAQLIKIRKAEPVRPVSPFAGNRRLQQENTPLAEIGKLPASVVIPRFWLGAGAGDRQDVANAEVFWQELRMRRGNVPLTLTVGGGHTMTTWRAEVPPMLKWMTQGLAAVVQREATAQSRKASILAAQRARSRASSMPIHHTPIRQKPANPSAPHKAVS